MLSLPLLLAFSSKVSAQGATVVEISNGTLDSSKNDGPRRKRVDVEPLVTGTHTIKAVWDSNADIKFTLFRLTGDASYREQIDQTVSSASPSQWTGNLDASEQYFLNIWSASGSANYTLTIQADTGAATPVEIISEPVDLTVTEGDDATFTVDAIGGSGTLSYQWFADNDPIDGATDSILIVSGVSLDDSDTEYQVQVTDEGNTTAFASAILEVIAEDSPVTLAIIDQPEDLMVNEGELASFSVTAVGSGTLSYQWFADGNAISGETTDTLFIGSTSNADNGNVYRVDISDDSGNSVRSNLATLMVNEDDSPTTIVNIGQGSVDSDKNVAPRWMRIDFDPLSSGVHTIAVSWNSSADVRYIVRESNDTRISPTIKGSNPGVWSGVLNQNKQYYLGLWSSDGIADFTASIQADLQLSITSQPSDVAVSAGSNATFTVDAAGSGILTYQWFEDNVRLPGENSESLTVFSTMLSEDGAQYAVEVSDGVNTIMSDIAILTVNSPPVDPVDENVLARWTMDEAAGTSIMLDVSGNGYHGTIGPDVVTGDADQGATSYRWLFTSPTANYEPGRIINVPHDSDLNPGSGNYSITMRYRTLVSFGNIIQKGQGGSSGGYWKIENPAGNLTCVFRGVKSNGDWNRKEVVSSTPLNDGQYHTITCERVNNELRLIVDGVLEDTASNSFGSISNNQPISIGGKTNCDNVNITCDYFSGWIDEISISVPE